MKQDKKIRLLITSGDGPRECRLAVSLAMKQMEKEARALNVQWQATLSDRASAGDIASGVVTLAGDEARALATRWTGTVQWTSQSPFRPHHKRRNWFIGVFEMAAGEAQGTDIKLRDLRFETFRAGGPGGQHQNTTDSAVRVTHIPTGQSVVSKDERSQHRNKQIAIERLADRLFLLREQAASKAKSDANQLHKELQRGNPVLHFAGTRFVETR